jgi:hypothetical protein
MKLLHIIGKWGVEKQNKKYTFVPFIHTPNRKMSTITLDKPKSRQRQIILNVPSRKYNFFMEVLGNFNFVQVEGAFQVPVQRTLLRPTPNITEKNE